MRMIEVSTAVYAAIWAARKAGEDSEEEILRRVLKVRQEPRRIEPLQPNKIGFEDSRFDIKLPEGFEIFRNYKGTEFRARAANGRWHLLGTGEAFDSLNQLSKATSGNIENAWRNWNFMGNDGKRYKIEGLRSDIPNNVRHLL